MPETYDELLSLGLLSGRKRHRLTKEEYESMAEAYATLPWGLEQEEDEEYIQAMMKKIQDRDSQYN